MLKKIVQKIRQILFYPFILIVMFGVWLLRKVDEIKIKKGDK